MFLFKALASSPDIAQAVVITKTTLKLTGMSKEKDVFQRQFLKNFGTDGERCRQLLITKSTVLKHLQKAPKPVFN